MKINFSKVILDKSIIKKQENELFKKINYYY